MDRAPFTLAPAGNPPALGPTWLGSGVLLGKVTSLADPEGRGRIQVRLHGSDGVADHDAPLWAMLVAPFAGNERGAWWVPDVDDLVAVAFVQGDARLPLVLGALWHGSAVPPESMDRDSRNFKKVVRSRNGVKITLDDTDGQEAMTLETPGGQKLTLKDGPGQCTLEDSNGNRIVLETSGIRIEASAKVSVQAAQVEVNAGMVTVNAGMSRFSGVVQCDTLITNAVVSSSYTPGAGNVW